jgi:hypothetical protein
MLGSHNLTNEGALYNRDASLLVRDPAVAAYFEKVFLFDWDCGREAAGRFASNPALVENGLSSCFIILDSTTEPAELTSEVLRLRTNSSNLASTSVPSSQSRHTSSSMRARRANNS